MVQSSKDPPVPLTQFIELWSGIATLHWEDRMNSKDLLEMRNAVRLHAEAMLIVAALRRYAVLLDNA